MGKVATKYNIDNEVVLLKEGVQHITAEIKAGHGPQETQRLQEWADEIKKGQCATKIRRCNRAAEL